MLNHVGTRSLPTPRLLLRQYATSDANDIYQNYATDARVTQYLSWQPYTDIKQLNEFISTQIACYANNIYNWVIEYSGQVIGSISVVAASDVNKACEVGYCLGYAYWGKGIMTEALSAVLGYLFSVVGYHRVCAKHDINNPASGKVMLTARAHCGRVCGEATTSFLTR